MADSDGNKAFDLIVIGSGPGGYVAAIRGAQLGLDVACVEADKLGGVCLNIGCIPTKALLSSAALVNEMKGGAQHGIVAKELEVDLGPAQERSQGVAQQLSRGVGMLFRKNKVTHIQGFGRLLGDGRVEVEDSDGNREEYAAGAIIIATGSRPRDLPVLKIDGKRIWSSTDALFQTEAPKTLAVIGAGAVGMEFADVFNAFGSEVTIIEALDRLLPVEDEECSEVIRKSFAKRGMAIHTGARLESSEVLESRVRLSFTDRDGKSQTLAVEAVLSAVGRIPNIEGLGLEEAGVEMTERGDFIAVDGLMRTNVDGVYAIGDCAGGPLLAHKASHEGIVAAEVIAGESHGGIDYRNIPNCTYTHPEVASVGMTEAEAREAGHDVEVGKFPWIGNGRALAAGHSEGFVKIVRDRRYSEILGAHIVGSHGTELIAEFVVGRHLESTVEEMEKAMHPHPTLSEAVADAALAALGRSINI